MGFPRRARTAKTYLAGALHAHTEKLVWFGGERKNSVLFIAILEALARAYPKTTRIAHPGQLRRPQKPSGQALARNTPKVQVVVPVRLSSVGEPHRTSRKSHPRRRHPKSSLPHFLETVRASRPLPRSHAAFPRCWSCVCQIKHVANHGSGIWMSSHYGTLVCASRAISANLSNFMHDLCYG
jgi:hypothetical protein